jgi:hypothetical protein
MHLFALSFTSLSTRQFFLSSDASSCTIFRTALWASVPINRPTAISPSDHGRIHLTTRATVAALRQQCRLKGLRVSSNKTTLETRLCSSPTNHGKSPPPKPRDWSKLGALGHDYERLQNDTTSLEHIPGGRDAVENLIAARMRAKLKQDYDTHVAIRKELSSFGVYIHDGIRMWRGDGVLWGQATGP